MKIYQLLPTLSRGDAIGNEAQAIRELLASEGYETGIFAERVDPRLPEGTASGVGEMPKLTDEDILLYHLSTGSRLNRLLPSFGGRIFVRYHNITPPEFFRGYSPRSYKRAKQGYEELRALAPHTEYALAVSGYNRVQMRENGYTCPIGVCPILIPFSDYDREPDAGTLARYQEDSRTNLLFVGRIAPNKKQEDIIRAFCRYRETYNPKSRLILAGNAADMQRYENRLRAYVKELGLEDAVVITGFISFAELLALYRAADVFVCMSEHEGFCVPLVEAMYFRKPIVAFRAAAIPETLGKGGLLLDSKDPDLAAAAVHRAVTDQTLREKMLREQQNRLKEFSYEKVRTRFLMCLSEQAEN